MVCRYSQAIFLLGLCEILWNVLASILTIVDSYNKPLADSMESAFPEIRWCRVCIALTAVVAQSWFIKLLTLVNRINVYIHSTLTLKASKLQNNVTTVKTI